jgi:predicted transposase/invertase (TIGR01784 family)
VHDWLIVELPEVRALRMDLLFQHSDGGLVQIEFQKTNDSTMSLRMAEYSLATYRLSGKFARQYVLYVGDAPLSMSAELRGPRLWFSYELVDFRCWDAEPLLDSSHIGDNVLAILAHLQDGRAAVHRILEKIAALPAGERNTILTQFGILSGLRKMGELVKEEIRKMPILEDIMDHDLLGPILRKGLEQGREEGRYQGELAILRRLIERRFGPVPDWAEENLAARSTSELLDLSVRLLDAHSLEQLLT